MKRKISLSEHLSIGFVRFSAGFTIISLFLILGYILWNGFFYSNRYEYTVTSNSANAIENAVCIANKKIHLNELPFDTLRNIFSDEYTTWTKVDSQDVDLYPYLDTATVASAPGLLAVAEPGSLVESPGDTATTVAHVAEQDGSVALVDRAVFESMDQKNKDSVKVIRLRTTAFAANPSVTELKENHRVGTIDESALTKLYRGEISNWSEFGGYNLPVVVVIPPVKDHLYLLVKKTGYAPSSEAGKKGVTFIHASSTEDYYALLSKTPGAAGLVDANKVDVNGLSPVKLARQESGQNLKLSFIFESPKDSGKIGGISTIILNTFAMIILTLLFSLPPGIFAAIYLVEYAREGKLVRLIRLGTETLAGVPSIIFGLFGMLVFVQGFGWGISLLSGSATLTLMILPTIIRTAEEALKSVPHSLQEGSIALGATKVQTIFRVVLPAAFPGIASGVILAAGRALGETAALIYTMGSNYNLTSGLLDSTRTLAVHIYLIIAEGISTDRAFSSAAVLVFIILGINMLARLIINRMGTMARG